jgi:hypothetical protein
MRWIVFFFLFSVSCLKAEITWLSHDNQGFSASASFSQKTMSLMEPLQITLTLTYPKTFHPDIEQIRMNLFQNIGIGETPFAPVNEHISSPETKKEGFLTQILTFILSPKMAGTHQLTFLDIPFDSDGQSVHVMSGITTVTVTLPPSLSSIPPYEPPLMTFSEALPVDLSPSNRASLLADPKLQLEEIHRNNILFKEKTIPWAGIILLIAAIIFAVYAIKKKHKLISTLPGKAIDPKVAARRELRQLSYQKMTPEELYPRLSSILSKFMEEHYQIRARSSTTEEFLKSISSLPYFQSKDRLDSLREFLTTADQIKFGHAAVSQEQSREHLLLVKNLITFE